MNLQTDVECSDQKSKILYLFWEKFSKNEIKVYLGR